MIKRVLHHARLAGPGCGCVAVCIAVLSMQGADAAEGRLGALKSLSLEALMDIEVTSVSKRPQKQSEAAAAIFVVTSQDIRRSGATNIPDVLRMVPGLHVARIDANKWAITSRGFNSRFANKLLVLLDGRSVYTPLFAGVYWETLNTPLEDIDRIEVVRGPGGTLWGANAVNGVINIITRSATETPGGLGSEGFVDQEQGIGTVRYGGELGSNGHYRLYGSYFSRDTGYNPAGAHDDWEMGQAGFRMDWQAGDADDYTLQGDYQRGQAGQQVTLPVNPVNDTAAFTDDTRLRGANLLFRWRRDTGEGSDFMLQAYVDYVGRDGPVLYEDRSTIDLEFQQHVRPRGRHDVLWGVGYRRIWDDNDNNPNFSLLPDSRSVDMFSAFIQDEIAIVEDRLALIVGSKFEHNDFTGLEYQPNLRLLWTPSLHWTLWASVARAVRTPARGEHDVLLRLVPPVDPDAPVFLVGDRDFESEELTAYELGYRWYGIQGLSFDLAAFYNDYDSLRTFDPVGQPPSPVLFPFDNRLEGNTYGLELAAQWQIRSNWRIRAGYTYLKMSLDLESGSTDVISEGAQDASPQHQATLRSALDLSDSIEFDTGLRYVDSLRVATGNPQMPTVDVDAYVALDARLAWRLSNDLELSLVAWNLLDKHHTEFVPDFIQTQPTEVRRSVYMGMKWRL